MAYLRTLKALERRLGQKGVADALNVSERTVRRWKQGTRKPSETYQRNIQASYSYLKNTKPLSKVKNRKKTAQSRLNRVDERLDVGYIVKKVERFKKAQTKHKEVDVTHLTDQEKIETIDTLHLKEGYTSFGVLLLVEMEEDAEGDEPEYKVKSSEYLRYEDFRKQGPDLIREMINSVKNKKGYKIKKVDGIFINGIKES